MQRSICEAAGHLLWEAPALGHALEWTLQKVLLAALLLWRAQVLFAIVASETSSWDREKLRTLSLEANCKGITLFVLALGLGVGTRELADLVHVASSLLEQHLLHLEGVSEAEVAYAWASRGTNQYPPPELIEKRAGPSRGDTSLQRILPVKRLPKHQFGKSGLTDDLEALEAAGSFREENREATLTSITQREALENYEKSSYDAEGNHQKDPAKLTNTGKKEKFRPCLW
ncbi:hypothetical protein MJT46_000034 [Ovis ammon polii x Ovis aries]|nr:hypothetical protein MJT46_000034 [Ovis ammon polii x Ovis aries]